MKKEFLRIIDHRDNSATSKREHLTDAKYMLLYNEHLPMFMFHATDLSERGEDPMPDERFMESPASSTC